MFGCNNDRLFPKKYTVKDHISNTKLEKGDPYYIQTRHKNLFFPLQPYSKKTLRKNVPKRARKYKRKVLMPPGHPIILLEKCIAQPVSKLTNYGERSASWENARASDEVPFLALASPFACGSRVTSRDSPKWRVCRASLLASYLSHERLFSP